MNNGASFNASCEFIRNLRLLSLHLNAIIKFADPLHYEELLKVRETIISMIPSYEALCATRTLYFMKVERFYSTGLFWTSTQTVKTHPSAGQQSSPAFSNFTGG